MPKITFSHNFLLVNFRKNLTFLSGLCLLILIFNLNSASVFAAQTPTLSVSVDNAAVNVNGNQVINSVNGTTELPINLTINTTNKTGYTATLNTETNETALVNSDSTNGAKIDSITASRSILNLPVNSWGFKTSNETSYNPIPSLATPTNIFQTTEKTNGNDVRGVNIGMKLGQNIESGSYDNKLIFSVVTNPYVAKAVMTEGPDFNVKLKALGSRTDKIEYFKKSTVAPAAFMNAVNIEDEESECEIKFWLNSTDKTAYYYTESEKVYLNTNSSKMFENSKTLSDPEYSDQKIKNILDLDLSNFDTSKVTDMSFMFNGMTNLTTLNLSNFDTSKVTNMLAMFASITNLTTLNLSNFDTSKVMNMNSMFTGMSSLTTLDLSNFDTSKVTNMGYMFAGMSNLTTLDLSNFNTSKVKYMHVMFAGMSNLTTLDLSSFDTSQVTDMDNMFAGMLSLTTLDLSNFDTSKVWDMSRMFEDVSSLTILDLSNFNTSKVRFMQKMFRHMSSLTTLNLSNFDTSNVEDMNYMFAGMSSLTTLDLSNFDTSQVTDMGYIFYLEDKDMSKDKLETIYVNNDFNTDRPMVFSGMFKNRKKLRGGNGSYLADPSTANKTWLRVDRPGVKGYFTRKS